MVLHWMRRGADAGIDVAVLADAAWATIRLSSLAAVAGLALAVPVGVLAARFRSRPVAFIERSTYVAHALPGIVIAISLVFVGVRLLRPVYQEVPLLVLAYTVLFLPLAVGAVRASVEQSPLRLEEAARSLGVPPHEVLARVTVPLASPGIAAGTALVFLSTMKELPATLLLRPTGTETLATRLWSATTISDYAAAGPYALAIMLLAAVPTALLSGLLAARADRPGRARR
jgi:iron(III) transport system permease protein